MVEVITKQVEEIISGPNREPPEDPDSLPEEGITYEKK